MTVEPPIKDPPRTGQPPNKGHHSRTLSHSISTFLTFEKGTTSLQGTNQLVPKCPLFGGSTVLDYSWSHANDMIGLCKGS